MRTQHDAARPHRPDGAPDAPARLTGGGLARMAVVGLGVVLALFAVVAVGGALLSSRATDELRRSGDVADSYLTALVAIALADVAEGTYRIEPAEDVLADFDRAARQGDAALARLEELGTPRDVAIARRARELFADYAGGVRLMFAAVRRGDEEDAERIDDEVSDRLQDQLLPLLSGAAPERAITTLNQIDELDQTQSRVLKATAAVVGVGTVAWILLLISWTLLRRRSDRAALARLAESRAQAETDDLTGLANRRGLYGAAQAALELSQAGGDPVALALVDLDRFKEINDTLGHGVGDDLLGQVGVRLRHAFAGAVGLGRLGGDEFVAVVAGPDAAGTAMRSSEGFLATLDEPFPLEGLLVSVRASIGIAHAPCDATERSVLLRHADTAMYRAKSAGGGVQVYAGETDDHGTDGLMLASELRVALDDDQIVLHYQPKADLATGLVTGVEALARWQHPTRGLLAPDLFLPLVERQGLMRALTLHVLRQSLAQAARWRAAGRPLQIAVNLSASDLMDVRFPDDVARLLGGSGVPPELLQLEITENTIMTDPVRVLDVLARLSELGLAFSLDDFGTGYSSLSYLKRLPVQELKIDRSFVMHMDSDPNDAAIVRSTVELARSLGMSVVAEGVESASAWEQLAGFGCDLAQGYHLSRPLPARELDAWLAARVAASGVPQGGS